MEELIRRVLFLPPAASTVAPGIDALHAVVLGISTLGAIATTLAIAAFVVRYRVRGLRRFAHGDPPRPRRRWAPSPWARRP